MEAGLMKFQSINGSGMDEKITVLMEAGLILHT